MQPPKTRLGILLCGLLLLHPNRAVADPDPALANAKKAFMEGRTHYLQQKYEEAAQAFIKAYSFKPIPAFLFNAAVAYEKGKKYAKAVEYFKKYLGAAPRASDAAEISKRIAALEKAIAAAATPPRRVVRPPPGEPPRRVVEPRARAVVVPVLPKIETKGVVAISTKPPGANIYLGSKMNKLGQSPWEGTLKRGEHEIIIEAEGYKPEKKGITVGPDRLVDLYVALSREHYLGWVQITSDQPGARIYLDDKNVGALAKTPYTGFIKPGQHKVWVRKLGYSESFREVKIVSGVTHKIHFQLEPLKHGWLTVAGATAYGAEVRLNGKFVCKVPCDRIVVQPGKHKVTITKKGYKPIEKDVIVHRIRHSTARVKMVEKPSLASAIVAYSFAAAFLAGGITMGYLTKQLRDDVRDEIDNGVLVNNHDARFKRGKIFLWVANGLFGLAGVAAIFGVYYTFADRGPKSTMRVLDKRVTILPELGPSYAGATARFRF